MEAHRAQLDLSTIVNRSEVARKAEGRVSRSDGINIILYTWESSSLRLETWQNKTSRIFEKCLPASDNS